MVVSCAPHRRCFFLVARAFPATTQSVGRPVARSSRSSGSSRLVGRTTRRPSHVADGQRTRMRSCCVVRSHCCCSSSSSSSPLVIMNTSSITTLASNYRQLVALANHITSCMSGGKIFWVVSGRLTTVDSTAAAVAAKSTQTRRLLMHSGEGDGRSRVAKRRSPPTNRQRSVFAFARLTSSSSLTCDESNGGRRHNEWCESGARALSLCVGTRF